MKRPSSGFAKTAFLVVIFVAYCHAMCLRKGANTDSDKTQVSPHGAMTDESVTDKSNIKIDSAEKRRKLYMPPNFMPTQAPKPSKLPTLSPGYMGPLLQAYCKKTNGAPPAVTTEEVICSILPAINASFNELVREVGDTYTDRMRKANIYGKALRLAFHDGGEYDQSKPDDKHGSDGCLSRSTDASYGMIEPDSIVETEFEDIWQQHCDKISRADFWVLLAHLTLVKAEPTGLLRLDYQFGRTDKHECEGGANRLPDAQKGINHIRDVFVGQYGLTMDEAAALIFGGHSLGHVHPEHSGYGYNEEELAIHAIRVPDDVTANSWDSTPDKFDNRNVGNLLVAGWLNIQNFNGHEYSNEKNVWVTNRAGQSSPTVAPASAPRHAPSRMPTMPFELTLQSKLDSAEIMLNTDMALAFEIANGDDSATPVGSLTQFCGATTVCSNPTTGIDASKLPETRNISEFFSSNSKEFGEQDPGNVVHARFLSHFATAWRKVINLGYVTGAVPDKHGESSSGKLGSVTTIELDRCYATSHPSPTIKPTSTPLPTTPAVFPDQAVCKKTNGAAAVASRANICSVYKQINESYQALIVDNGNLYDTNIRTANIYGKALRLAFHDGGETDMSKPNDMHGSDGCLSQGTDASYGLIEPDGIVNTEFENIWQQHCDKISRADFWVMLANCALHLADPTDMLSLDFQWGRVDKKQCEGGQGRLPDGQKGIEHIRDVFVGQYGLTMDEAAVLILGGHSLGHVHPEWSGYGYNEAELIEHAKMVPDDDAANAWDSTPQIFDNRNAGNLLVAGWMNTQNFNGHHTSTEKNMWTPNKAANNAPSPYPVSKPVRPPTMQPSLAGAHSKLDSMSVMLNTDMALAFGIDLSEGNVGVNSQFCSFTETCMYPDNGPTPETRNITEFYSSNSKELGEYDPGHLINTRFMRDFVNAFRKVTSLAYGGEPSWKDGESRTGKLGTLTTIDLSKCEE